MNQIAAKDSKAKILDAFRQILAERQKIESKVATIEEEAQKAENQRVLEAASQYTADSIVRGLADLQLDFGTIISGLSAKTCACRRFLFPSPCDRHLCDVLVPAAFPGVPG